MCLSNQVQIHWRLFIQLLTYCIASVRCNAFWSCKTSCNTILTSLYKAVECFVVTFKLPTLFIVFTAWFIYSKFSSETKVIVCLFSANTPLWNWCWRHKTVILKSWWCKITLTTLRLASLFFLTLLSLFWLYIKSLIKY